MRFICPKCKSPQLSLQQDCYVCAGCRKRYPIIAGIPDFRVYSFPYSDDESSDVRVLLASFAKLDYFELFKLRQSLFLDKSKTLEAQQEARALHEASLKNLATYHFDHSDIFSRNVTRFRYIIGERIDHGLDSALELGCGRGTQLADMLSLYGHVTAIDNSLSELILTKKILEHKSLADRVTLVAACSEALPFQQDSFDVVNMRSVLEHVEDQEGSLHEVKGALRKGGLLLMEVPNRFTLGREPHVKIFGVGFVPRRWMRHYVHMLSRGQLTFGGTETPSYWELKRLLNAVFDTNWVHRVRLIEESRSGVTLLGKLYRRFAFVKCLFENAITKSLCETHLVAAWKD
ncbi:methyltransferase domain-containing protein [Elusimicrobiota bacterium]